jgi:hypothetical protein
MVDKQLDNLAGDVTKLGSAWEGFVLKGEGGVNVFREAVKFANDAIVQLSNLDLIFTRSVKLTDDQVGRTLDALMASSGKKNDMIRDIFERTKDMSISALMESEDAIKKELKGAKLNKVERGKLFDEFVRRRQSQIEIEEKAVIDAEKAKLDAAKKAEQAKEEAEEEARKKASEARKKDDEARLKELDKLTKERVRLEAKGVKDSAALEKQALDVLDDLESDATDDFEKEQEEMTDFLEKELKKRIDKKQDENDKTLDQIEKEKEAREEMIYTTSDLLAQGFELANTFIDRKITKEEQARELELAGVESSRMSEDQKAKAKEEINEKYNKKIAEFQRKQAINEKIAGLFSIGVNTSIAVSKALAQGNPILAAIVAALGAAQLATVAAQPIPQFEKGTQGKFNTPSTFIAGEAGAEIVESRSGKRAIVDKATMFTNSSGMRVYSNPELERMQQFGVVGFDDHTLKAQHETLKGIRKDLARQRYGIHQNGREIGHSRGS